jgi:hypothetical protein
MSTTITLSEVHLVLNPASLNNVPMMNQSGSIPTLYVNGQFQTVSGNYITSYNNSFQLTGSDLTSSISNIDTLAETKVKAALGL